MSKKKARRGGKPKRLKRRPALSREDKAALELLEEYASPEVAREYRKALQFIRRGRVSEGVESIIRLGQQDEVGTLILSNKSRYSSSMYSASWMSKSTPRANRLRCLSQASLLEQR